MINVIFFGYRNWAINIFDSFKDNPKIKIIDVVLSQENYLNKASSFNSNVDVMIFVGWSWIIPSEITSKFLCIGIHPSDLPYYRGGSPIQHQIIDGVVDTKISLMTLSSEKLDAGEIWLKQYLNLSGSDMTEVFSNITESSIVLLNNFFEIFPNITPQIQDISQGSYFKRRTSNESELNRKDFIEKDLEYVYNFIRSLTEPYPNAFIQDDEGNKLYFTGIKYVKNEQ